MKHHYLIGLLIAVFSHGLQAQITFRPVVISQCTGEVVEDIHVFVEGADYDSSYGPFDVKKEFTLPDSGWYEVNIGMFMMTHFPTRVKFHVPDVEVYRDTFYLGLLSFYMCICSPPRDDYRMCGEPAHGTVRDYYYNGNLRAIGTFDSSQIRDSVVSYHSNGVVQQRKYKLKGKTRKSGLHRGHRVQCWDSRTYSENGTLVHHYNNWKGFIKNYHDDGSLQKWIDFDGPTRTYHPNGELKSISKAGSVIFGPGLMNKVATRKEYSEDGSLLFVWKNDGEHYDSVTFEAYENGKVVRRVDFRGKQPYDGSNDAFPREINEIDRSDYYSESFH